MTPVVLVRHGQGMVHTARPARPLLPDGRLSFHDVPVCGTRGTSWRPVEDVRLFTRSCRRCEAVLQRERAAALGALMASGRAQLEQVALLELVRGWSDRATLGRLKLLVIESRDAALRSAFADTARRLGEHTSTRQQPPAMRRRWSRADRCYLYERAQVAR